MRSSKVISILLLFVVSTLLLGCSSSKKNQQGIVKQSYHNITARNNAYFNADLKLKTLQQNIKDSYQDDYDEILSLYPQRDPKSAQTYASELDEVIKKASYAIKLHETSKWADNCYMLVGEAYYLKGDYETAIETFQFITTEFKGGYSEESLDKAKQKKKKSKKKKKRKKRKKKGKPQSRAQILEEKQEERKEEREEKEEDKGEMNFIDRLKHQPVRPDVLIWLVDAYTTLEKYKEAETVVTLIEADEYFPENLYEDLQIAKANLYIKRGNLYKAIEPVTELTNIIRRKKNKTRYYYILGQIYERLKMYPSARENYQQVLKCRPVYDMEFNAKMSIARVSSSDNSITTEEVSEILTKLLKDDKNIDFYDQIYYAMAEIEFNNGNKEEAIKYYKKSIRSSTTNQEQKGQAYLRLAEIYYADQLYEKAQPYYDSTVTTLSSDYENYNEIKTRSEVLDDLVKQIKIIEEQDSLLYLSSLTDEERDQLIEDMVRKKEVKEKQKELQDKVAFQENKNEIRKTTQETGKWYFYNPTAKASGFNDFIRRWGNRELEDNWRRSDKSSLAESDVTEDEEEEGLLLTSEGAADKDALLEAVPTTEADIKAANDQIIQAYYRMASIYNRKLNNNEKAIESFEELLERYPENEYLSEVYYNLYVLHDQQGNRQKADKYRSLLLNEFPDSRYAKYLKNPNFLEAQKSQQQEIEDYYRDTYNLYASNQLDAAFLYIRRADTLFEENGLKPKFALLEAMAIGKKQGFSSYIAALENVIQEYPGDKVKLKAQEILSYLSEVQDSAYQMEMNISKYGYDPDAIHFFVIAYTNDDISSNDLVNSLANYNDANRSIEELKINSLVLNDKHTLVIVKSFKNLKKANSYYNAMKESESVFKDVPKEDLKMCIVSDINFNKIISNREMDSYFHYFNSRYVNQIVNQDR